METKNYKELILKNGALVLRFSKSNGWAIGFVKKGSDEMSDVVDIDAEYLSHRKYAEQAFEIYVATKGRFYN